MPTQAQIDSFATAAATAYRAVYDTFERSATDEGASASPVRNDCFIVNKPNKHTTVEVLGALKIDRLPKSRRAPGKVAPAGDRIAVLMASKEIFGFDDTKPAAEASYLHEAFVNIGYYHVSTKGWRALLGLHYDYSARGATQGHPLFHAQMHDGSASAGIAGLPVTPVIQPLPQSEVFGAVRLPTANMIGASALLKLSADHLSHDSFTTVLSRLRAQAFFKNWRCKCDTLDDADSARGLLAAGWYGSKA